MDIFSPDKKTHAAFIISAAGAVSCSVGGLSAGPPCLSLLPTAPAVFPVFLCEAEKCDGTFGTP